MHDASRAFSRAFANAGNNIDAKMAIIAITTNNSMRVNELCFFYERKIHRHAYLLTVAICNEEPIFPIPNIIENTGGDDNICNDVGSAINVTFNANHALKCSKI